MTGQLKSLVGKRFGRLVVKSFYDFQEYPRAKRRSRWLCVCDCGNTSTPTGKSLREGTKSCGCLQKEAVSRTMSTHGQSRTKVYKVWSCMKDRCMNPKNSEYLNYGGRGISVSREWADSFETFLSDMGVPERGRSLERMDNSLGYSKENCVWATLNAQRRNMRTNVNVTYQGRTQCLNDWCKELGIPFRTARQRLRWAGVENLEVVFSKQPIRRGGLRGLQL